MDELFSSIETLLATWKETTAVHAEIDKLGEAYAKVKAGAAAAAAAAATTTVPATTE